jgi:hypothetical protein
MLVYDAKGTLLGRGVYNFLRRGVTAWDYPARIRQDPQKIVVGALNAVN